jgi:hypothetical protein
LQVLWRFWRFAAGFSVRLDLGRMGARYR